MELTANAQGEQVVVTLAEPRIDAAIATRFKDKMREIISRHSLPVLVDMRSVQFMDSSGLGAMIAVHKAMPHGLHLTLQDLTPDVMRVFRLTRMDSVFQIRASDDQQKVTT